MSQVANPEQERRSARRLAIAAMLAFAASALVVQSADALTIDFGEFNPWTSPTTTSETYVFPDGTVVVTVNDPSNSLVTVAGDAAGPSVATSSYLNPPDNAANNPNPQSLFLRTNGNGTGGNAMVITIDFMFAGGVTDIQFDLFDVDYGAGQWRDRIRLRSTEFGTGTVGNPTSVSAVGGATPVWVFNANNGVIRGTGDSSGGSGNASDGGTARVDFMGASFTRIELQYANADPARGQQWISLSDITFTFVPEPSSAALLMLGLLALAHRRRSTR